MATPSQRINVTELDFDQIKRNLIAYFQLTDSPFKDWDFSGSGLNILIDLLSHNTHYNAMLAHMAVNETFIDSAQLRPNVVSSAKLIGYVPASYSSPKANVTISVPIGDNTSGSITVPTGTIFTTTINNVIYEFTNIEDINLTAEGLLYIGTGDIYQGTIVTRRFQVNNLQSSNQYIIADKNIDINSLHVAVYPSETSVDITVYNKFTDIAGINGSSPIYFINENYNGNYFISFGNNIFGKQPNNLSVLELTYLITAGIDANGANLFFTTGSSTITTNDVASGGLYNESIDSIKFNAPINFIAQNRAVTADDYKAIIKKDFQNAQTIAVWGGEENDPPYYGKVFISIAKSSDLPGVLNQLTLSDRDVIMKILSGKKVLSIIPEIVDYDYVNIILDVMFKYNRNQTSQSQIQLENYVSNVVSNFNTQYLQSFDGVFRHSLLLKTIDNSSPAILNSLVRVYLSKSFTIHAGLPTIQTIKYGSPLAVEHNMTITFSGSWTYHGRVLYLGDIAHASDSNLRTVYSYYIANNMPVIDNANIGNINLSTGIVELDYIDADSDTTVSLDLIPASNDIASSRNVLLQIDTNRTSVYAEVDTISIGGANRAVDYSTFKRDR